MLKLLLIPLLLMAGLMVMAQGTFPVNGAADERPEVFAITGATIVKDYRTSIENATMVVRKGRITALGGSDVAIPAGAVVYDATGRYIYPAFIDLYSTYGMPEVKIPPRQGRPSQLESDRSGPYGWNDAIKADFRAEDHFQPDTKSADEMRSLGFGAALVHRPDGIMRGSAALVHLGEGRPNDLVLKPMASAAWSFVKGSSTQAYPSSLMGAIALIRQTLYDAQWYARARKVPGTPLNATLEAVIALQELPVLFPADDRQTALRIARLCREFNLQAIIRGSGDEYQRVQEIRNTQAKFILPLSFPEPFDVEDPIAAINVRLADMKHWEMAPANAAFLEAAGVPFAFTLDGLKKKETFHSLLRTMYSYGLSDTMLLKALTLNPARFAGADRDLGSLDPGKVASFTVASGHLLSPDFTVLESWVNGKRYMNAATPQADVRGTYSLETGSSTLGMVLKGPYRKPVIELKDDTVKLKARYTLTGNIFTLNYLAANDTSGYYRLNGQWSVGNITGTGIAPDGSRSTWQANRTAPHSDSLKLPERKSPDWEKIYFPFSPYGFEVLPGAEKVLIRNATVWTNEAEGILERTDVLLDKGKISAIGRNLPAEGALEIDGSGKHLTAGIIDEHSHIAISRGVNEGTMAITPEVRIGDVINAEDINIYRQLGGGVTASQLLHGSANPIGGQSALIKLRWGRSAEEMKFEQAAPFIKFALGENVKQSNRGEQHTSRFPQTRMGVEQVMFDAFHQASQYLQEWEAYNKLSRKDKELAIPPRTDLQMRTLAEILLSERFITCHSYVQSEINMLMKVADSFGFRINTFTHILEGYKLADKMKAHGAGASTFSDWWAYKYEVVDAIPYNAAILARMGVVTAINSDDAEMGRRLNQEAAKVVKYGRISEEEAWKMVTLNPAKLLQIDHRVGSIKAGKDADVVLWSDNPLSIYARAEKTWVDGVRYYDLQRDQELRERIRKERDHLIQKMLAAKADGSPTQKVRPQQNRHYHCDDVEDELIETHHHDHDHDYEFGH